MILSFIKSLFRRKENKNSDNSQPKKERSDSPDFIDYDGMGNQGRFPTRGNK
jgi:hypothetical protein